MYIFLWCKYGIPETVHVSSTLSLMTHNSTFMAPFGEFSCGRRTGFFVGCLRKAKGRLSTRTLVLLLPPWGHLLRHWTSLCQMLCAMNSWVHHSPHSHGKKTAAQTPLWTWQCCSATCLTSHRRSWEARRWWGWAQAVRVRLDAWWSWDLGMVLGKQEWQGWMLQQAFGWTRWVIEHLEMLNECIIVVSCIMCKLIFIYSLFYGRDKKIKSFFFHYLIDSYKW